MEIVAAYADGGVIGTNPSKAGGTYAWCHIGADGIVCNGSGVIEPPAYGLDAISNNISELVALLRCLYALPLGWSGKVYTDSYCTLRRVFYAGKLLNVPQVLADRIPGATARLGTVECVLLDGHPTKEQLAQGKGKRGNLVSEWNCWCDKECGRVAKEFKRAAV